MKLKEIDVYPLVSIEVSDQLWEQVHDQVRAPIGNQLGQMTDLLAEHLAGTAL